MTVSDKLGSCSVSECKISDGGSCLEGFTADLVACPNYSESALIDPPDGSVESDAPNEEVAEEPDVLLSSGRALKIPEANALAASQLTTVVLLAGPHESGKTTLLASLFEKFRSGPFAGHVFAGSETLVAFETICHFSRAASELDEPDTERTKVREGELVHLALESEAGSSSTKNLLLSDISGEIFERANFTNENLRRIPFLERADHLSLFFDGGRLSDSSSRHACKQQGLTLLRACCEEEVLQKTCSLSVVFSRQDLVEADRENTESFQRLIEEEVARRYAGFFDTAVRCVRLAARPKEVKFGPPIGVGELLNVWLQEQDRYESRRRHTSPIPSKRNQADSYLWKRLGVQ